MKRKFLTLVALLATLSVGAQTSEVFSPYQATALRLPSVPIVVNDPYFSIWSPYDKLTDGTTRHWTNDEMPLTGMLRVDGTTYRFMGAEKEYVLDPIAAMAMQRSCDATRATDGKKPTTTLRSGATHEVLSDRRESIPT